jgi:hypothetical protein
MGSGPDRVGAPERPGGTRKDRGILTILKEVPSAKNTPRSKTPTKPAPASGGKPGAQPGGRPGARRRAATKAKPARDVPVLPLAIGGLFLAVFLGLIVWYKVQNASSPTTISGQPVNSIQCETGEQLATHYHAHVDILWKNQPVPIPANTGIPSGGNCLYWMHTHDDSGVIHIEAPVGQASRKFTLGDFFAVWGQPLSRTQVATLQVGSGNQLKIWVNGTPYTGDPSNIVLKSHEQIVIEIGPPFTQPPPTFSWPAGL